MSEWVESPLAELAYIVSGGTPSRDVPAYWGGEIPWVTPTDITACRTNYLEQTEDTISKQGLLGSSAKLLPAGAILLTSRASIGLSKIARIPVTTNQGFKSLVPKQGIDETFLFYQTQRLRGSFERFAAGSTFLEINKKDTERILLPHPTSAVEQRKIATILTSIDTAIEKTEALIAKYQQIKAGLMHDLFTRGVLPNGQLRPTREQAPELYQETAIGWIPREWDISTLRTCLLGNPTNGIYKSADQIGAEGMLMVGQTAFTVERSVDFSLCRRGLVSPPEIRHYGLAEGNILMTRVFATIEGVGLPTLVPQLPEPAVYESNMLRLQVNLCSLIPRLLFEWLRSPAARAHISSRVNASNQCSVNQSAINSLPVPIPSPDEQNWINSRIDAADKRIANEVTILEKLKKQRIGLMHDLLTGKVPVKVEEPEMADG